MNSKEFENKVKELIDDLKGVSNDFGLGNICHLQLASFFSHPQTEKVLLLHQLLVLLTL